MKRILLTTLAVAGVVHALLALPASAQSDASCGGISAAALSDPLVVARITKSAPKVHFVLDAGDGRQECPAAGAACRDTAYLVPGDVVLALPGPHRGHLCASYANKQGRETSGWLPAASLVEVAPAPVGEAGWLGTWVRTEAEIRIRRGKQGLTVVGSATYGAMDKSRVERGAVNMGDFDGAARRSGDTALVADKDIVSFDATPADRCAVQMRRAGPYLIVEDNRACGGMNVSFTGLYVRR